MHVWARDRLPAGEFDYEPGIEPLTDAVAEEIAPSLVATGVIPANAINQIAQPGDRILDLIMIDPGVWMLGWHAATSFVPSCWPGAFLPFDEDHEAVSRAYYKAAEGFLWSMLPIRPDDVAVEIGSAPGGAVQRMLELGLKVIGVDPADMDPEIAENPNFFHIRARGDDIKRSEYRGARWLLVDSNVRPDKALATVENIVTNNQVDIRGMLLTMKLGKYSAAHRIPGWCQTLATWGFKRTEVRQLATGRCEVCIAAMK
jgi:23S rRNA (cytidine2498-2'-O)-methyltransferase